MYVTFENASMMVIPHDFGVDMRVSYKDEKVFSLENTALDVAKSPDVASCLLGLGKFLEISTSLSEIGIGVATSSAVIVSRSGGFVSVRVSGVTARMDCDDIDNWLKYVDVVLTGIWAMLERGKQNK